jgi:hypothetical protein
MLVELRVGEQRYRAVWEVLESASVTEVARRFGVSLQSVLLTSCSVTPHTTTAGDHRLTFDAIIRRPDVVVCPWRGLSGASDRRMILVLTGCSSPTG